RLRGRGVEAAILEAADFARVISDGGATRWAGTIAGRAIALATKLLSESGVPVLVDAGASLADIEGLARTLVDDLAQVELMCPTEPCRTRERAVRWNLVAHPAAAACGIAPDLGLAYEPARRPDLVLYTDAVDVVTAAGEVLRLIERLELGARER